MCYSTTQDIREIITEGGMNDFQEGEWGRLNWPDLEDCSPSISSGSRFGRKSKPSKRGCPYLIKILRKIVCT